MILFQVNVYISFILHRNNMIPRIYDKVSNMQWL